VPVRRCCWATTAKAVLSLSATLCEVDSPPLRAVSSSGNAWQREVS